MKNAVCFPSHIAEKPITTASQKTLTASGAHWTKIMISINDLDFVVRDPGGGTPIHYLYGYVPAKGVMILKLLI